MQITVDMPVVSECAVTECAYNNSQACHAKAITVGDGANPGCDTYLGSASHTRRSSGTAGVGACKVSHCKHNDDFECQAESINVGFESSQVHCLTFMPS